MTDEEARSPETTLAFDMAKRAVPLAPVIVLVAAVVRGGDGAWSALVAVALVVVNLLLSAAMLTWAARISLTMIMAAALGGFLVRMGLVTAVIVAVKDRPWIDLPTLAVAVLVTHLGLLVWELRYVSASLAYPSLKPRLNTKEAAGS